MTRSSALNPAASGGELITEDRGCNNCGYSLLGLPAGGLCPECGFPIPTPSRRFPSGDNLTDAPRTYLRLLSIGLSGAAIAALILGIGLVSLADFNGVTAALALSVGSVLWFLSNWIVTRPRPLQNVTVPDATLDNRVWLRLVLSAQLSWVVLACFAVLFEVAAGRNWNGWYSVAFWGVLVFSLVSVLALVPLLVYLTSLALWAGDHGLGSRLRASAWAIGFCGPVNVILSFLAPHTGIFIGLVSLIALVMGLFFLFGLGMAMLSLVQLSTMAAWAIRNNAAIRARSIRIAKRRAEEMRETAERQKAVMSPNMVEGGGGPPATQNRTIPFPAGQRASTSGLRIEPSQSGEIYELEPRDDD